MSFRTASTSRRSARSEDRRAVRRQLFAGRADAHELEEAFIVLNANRPWRESGSISTIEGFARFARGKPGNVRLYLHHAILLPGERERIDGWIDAAGIRDRVIMPAEAWGRARSPRMID